MIKPEPALIKALAYVVRTHPEIMEWIAAWRMHELEQLPHAISCPAVFQGRCQVLGELYKFAKEAPSLAAKL